jgi:hypothetical protein
VTSASRFLIGLVTCLATQDAQIKLAHSARWCWSGGRTVARAASGQVGWPAGSAASATKAVSATRAAIAAIGDPGRRRLARRAASEVMFMPASVRADVYTALKAAMLQPTEALRAA